MTNDNSFSNDSILELKKSLETVFDNKDASNVYDAQEMEVIKIMFASLMDNKNLKSLSSLTIGQRDDILDGLLLYSVFGDTTILMFIENLLQLNKSLIKNQGNRNFLEIISDIAGKTQNYFETDTTDKKFLGRIR